MPKNGCKNNMFCFCELMTKNNSSGIIQAFKLFTTPKLTTHKVKISMGQRFAKPSPKAAAAKNGNRTVSDKDKAVLKLKRARDRLTKFQKKVKVAAVSASTGGAEASTASTVVPPMTMLA